MIGYEGVTEFLNFLGFKLPNDGWYICENPPNAEFLDETVATIYDSATNILTNAHNLQQQVPNILKNTNDSNTGCNNNNERQNTKNNIEETKENEKTEQQQYNDQQLESQQHFKTSVCTMDGFEQVCFLVCIVRFFCLLSEQQSDFFWFAICFVCVCVRVYVFVCVSKRGMTVLF